jgi:acyl-CoA synthetase (AMP-forming)/AMP-acid ligase II
VPRRIWVVDQLPRTATGKVQRGVLADRFLHGTSRLPETLHTVLGALDFWAEITPAAVALLSPGQEPATYRELAEAVGRLAGELRARGLGRQDGIALLLPAGPQFCLALLATISVGIAVPFGWPSSEAMCRRILANPRVRAVVVSGEGEPPALEHTGTRLAILSLNGGASGHLGDLRIDGTRFSSPMPAERTAAENIALILHSYGTMGRPKPVPRLHRNSVATCRTIIETRALTSADCCLSLSPTAYSQGLITLMTAVFSGGSLVSVPEPDVAALPRWLRTYRPTSISTTPAVLRTLAMVVNRGELQDALLESPLRCILSSVSPLSPDKLDELESTLGAPILNIYGMSEASFIAGEYFAASLHKPGSVGVPNHEVAIVEASGTPVTVGDTGEIVVRGPNIFPGYLGDPDANAAAILPRGRFRTGDVGRIDEDGILFVTGHLKLRN